MQYVNVPGGVFTGIGAAANALITQSNGTVNFDASNLPDGRYRIMYTSPNSVCNNPVAYAIVIVNKTPTVSIVTNNTGACGSVNMELTAVVNPAQGVSYIWSTGESTPTINVPTTTSSDYTVLIIGVSGCTASASITVSDPFPSGAIRIGTAFNIPDVTAANAQYSNDFLATGTLATNNPIIVAGNFTIDMSLNVHNPNSPNWPYSHNPPTWKMLPGASITVAPNATLDLTECTIESYCNEMWQGITVESYGKLILNQLAEYDGGMNYFYGNTISDAYHAIEAKEKARISSVGTTFSNNYTVLYNEAGAFDLLKFEANALNGDLNGLKPAYTGQPAWADFAQVGVHIKNNTYFVLDNPNYNTLNPQYYNLFQNLTYGVFLENTNATIKGYHRFENIPVTGLPNAVQEGSAIFAEQGVLDYSGSIYGNGSSSGVASTQNMTSVQTGVFARQLRKLNVSGITMNDASVGVLLEDCNGKNNIVTNFLHCKDHGVQANGINNAMSFRIADNHIFMSDDPDVPAEGCGIGLYGFGLNLVSSVTNDNIFHNTIHTGRAAQGILVIGENGTSIKENEIDITENDHNTQGITTVYNKNCTVQCNSITGQTLPTGIAADDYGTIGLLSAFTTATTISCNHTDNTHTGMFLVGGNDNNTLQSNVFGTHHWGLDFGASITIGDQGKPTITPIPHGNRWIGEYTGADAGGARHEGVKVAGKLIGQFYAKENTDDWSRSRSGATITNPYSFAPDITLTIWQDWFQNRPFVGLRCNGTSNNLAACINSNGTNMIAGNSDESFDLAVATGELEASEFIEEMKTWNKRILYEKLKENPQLVYNNTFLEMFKDDIEQTVLDDIYTIAKKRAAAAAATVLEKQTIEQSTTVLEGLTEELLHLDSLLSDTTQTAMQLALYESEKVAKLQALDTQEASYKSFLIAYEQGHDAKAEAAKIENTTMPTVELYAENEKIINEIYLNTVVKSEKLPIAEDAKIQVNAIAAQCPIVGSPAVYLARSLQARYQIKAYKDWLICKEQNINLRKPKPQMALGLNELTYNLQPNPANSYINVIASKSDAIGQSIELQNVLGIIVLQKTITETTMTISVENLPAGIYLCKIGTFTSKVIVTH